MTSISKGFEIAGDVLQYAMPAAGWLSDISHDLYENNFAEALKKTVVIAILILVQNQTTTHLKTYMKKPRPNPEKRGFAGPSGHMMIATQSTVRLVSKYGFFSPQGALAIAGAAIVALGRYLPGQHDIIDLTEGSFLGAILGQAWNSYMEN
jgi:hypothetical protein